MGLSLSPDIRRRFALLIDDGLSARAAARRLLISPASGVRLASKLRQGESLDPARQGRPAGRGKLSAHQGFLTELVEQDPDITLAELRDALIMAEDVKVHPGSIARMLARLGYTYKKSRWLRPSAARPAFAISEPNGSRNACR